MTDDRSFYDAFAKRMQLDSNENNRRPRIGGAGGDAYELTSDGIRRGDTNLAAEEAYNYNSLPVSQNEPRSTYRVDSGMMSTAPQYGATKANSIQLNNSVDFENEADLRREFANHFRQKHRQKTPQNHHDFLNVIKH